MPNLTLTEGLLSYRHGGCNIVFFKDINLDLLSKGFYVDKRISKRQLQIQREIIQDFLTKKIKISHVESLLVLPDKIKTPSIAKVNFINPDLIKTEKEQPLNNQIRAVQKGVGNQNIFLIQGPPGTGKTTVIAEIIEQLVLKGEKILVSGQNHVSVDNVLRKLSNNNHLNLLRVGNPDKIDNEVLRYTIDHLVEEYKHDFNSFISNQLELAIEFSSYKLNLETKRLINEKYNKRVNELVQGYQELKEIFKQRHFKLRDTLYELDNHKINVVIETLKNWIESSKSEYEILLKPFIYQSVDVVFATCIGIRTDQVFSESEFKFDTVIIDEAGKANIAETVVAMELGKKAILVGDQKQLPPYIDSSLLDEMIPNSFPRSHYGLDLSKDEILHALKTSFFEFLVERVNIKQFPKENLIMLNYQYRMHPNIGKFVSDTFYDGSLRMGENTKLNKLILPAPLDKEIIFFDTSNLRNPYERSDGFSVKNLTEAETITYIILPRLFESNISPTNIAIIAPYKSQVTTIKNCISNSQITSYKIIDVSTVDSFQGKEYDIIIFSFTRSVDHSRASEINGKIRYVKVGFLDDARRLNVAFSRAKKKLILVGNASSLTDARSHFDMIFNYTSLFNEVVALSKKPEIGNYINLASHKDIKSPFKSLIDKYKAGDKVDGKFKMVGRKGNSFFGLFINIKVLPIF